MEEITLTEVDIDIDNLSKAINETVLSVEGLDRNAMELHYTNSEGNQVKCMYEILGMYKKLLKSTEYGYTILILPYSIEISKDSETIIYLSSLSTWHIQMCIEAYDFVMKRHNNGTK